MTGVATQEKRFFWTEEVLKELLNEVEITPSPSWEGSLYLYYRLLQSKIDEQRLKYVQAVWKAKFYQKKYLRMKQCTVLIDVGSIKIQQAVRQHNETKPFKELLKVLKKQKKETKAVVLIQSQWRGYKTRKIHKKLREKQRLEKQAKLQAIKDISEQLLEIEQDDHQQIDKWFEENEEDRFDRLMNNYLANEKMIYHPESFAAKRQRIKKKKNNASGDKENMALLIDDDMFNDESSLERGIVNNMRPPSPPNIYINQTLELSKERHRIMMKLTKQV